MATPGKARPSGLPARGSAIPTPGTRMRSTSTVSNGAGQHAHPDDELMSRAFADAIRTNDPAHHRLGRVSDVSTVSSLAPSLASSTSRRPSSVTSASSAGSFAPPKPITSRTSSVGKAHPPPRAPSRGGDVFRSASRGGHTFDVGDNVRIESLGFEGVLRFIGEIDGKAGDWAGVELSGGFKGKGKNDGSVAGKHYFYCPTNCGVFVATTKLSAPTVGPSAMSRPASVASSRNGRITPSMSSTSTMSTLSMSSFGRVTPSVSRPSLASTSRPPTGRATPAASTGRITPGLGRSTSSVTSIRGPQAKTPVSARTASADSPEKSITPGSRASKYVGMTARQLNVRNSMSNPARAPFLPSSPSKSPTRQLGSPVRRSTSSPMHTPRALGRASLGAHAIPKPLPSPSRASLSTPKRVPGPLAMPPPPSPGLPALASSASEEALLDRSVSQIEHDGRALQDKINRLVQGRTTPGSPKPPFARRPSVASLEQQAEIERLQSRLDALEYENNQLRETQGDGSEEELERVKARLETLETERSAAQTRTVELEATLRVSERSLDERTAKVEALERDVQLGASDLERAKSEAEGKLKNLQSELEDNEALLKNLQEAMTVKEGAAVEHDAVLKAKDAELSMLQNRLQKVQVDLEEERRELTEEVDELRQAGQETIALYEERLSAADSKRYEMEDLIAALQEEIRNKTRPMSPGEMARQAASAAEIDNENLREQVQHLQKRIGVLEDDLEEARATVEHEEEAADERSRRGAEKEEAVRKELVEARKEVEMLKQAEAKAKERVSEAQEAVRENGSALENARAEIEGLRAELADLQGLAANGESSAADMAQRSAAERARHAEELASLRSKLDETGAVERELNEQLEQARHETEEANKALASARQSLASADDDKIQLENAIQELQAKFEKERHNVLELREELEERTKEVDVIKKRHNRDASIVNGVFDSPSRSPSVPSSPSKHESSAHREEIRGLKLIVQNLQQDNHTSTQKIKSLEAENQLLVTETEKLRDELKVLEDNFEQTILREEAALNEAAAGASGDELEALRLSLKEAKNKHELEAEQLRKRLSEAESKSARTIHDLNKEITELEALVETKIYREDELERELERLNSKLSKGRKSTAKGSVDLHAVPEDRAASPTPSSSAASPRPGRTSVSLSSSARSSEAGGAHEEVCEICERPGHDIFTCDVLGGTTSPTMAMSRLSATGGKAAATPPPLAVEDLASPEDDVPDVFCEDCEGYGHTAANCPHSQDVF